MNIRNKCAIGMLVVGSFQMLGHALQQQWLRGIGLASGIAPFTKVFCEADGYEAFAATFTLEGTMENGTVWSRKLDPEWYAQLDGPYNRRNVYGAALAFAPRLPEPLREELIRQSLAPGSALRAELQVPAELKDLRVLIQPKGASCPTWIYRAPTTES